MTTPSLTAIESGEEVLARIRELLPLIRKNAAEGERNRRVSDETINALKDAGAFRIATPRRYGGYETSLRTMLDVSALIAEADGGTAWVVTLSNVNAWSAGSQGGQAADELFADGPDTIVAGVIAPTGKARKVPGGYRVSGTWAYSSASLHADWAAGGVYVVDDNDQVLDQGLVSIPKDAFRVEDTWYVAGMRASGSNTIVVDDVFVPEHRFGSLLPVLAGSYLSEHPDAPFYRSAIGPMLVMVLIGPQLGLGRAALNLVLDKAANKPLAYTSIERQADSVAFQLLIAEAALKIDTAHLHAYRAADDVQRYAELGEYPDVVARSRIRGDAAVALRSINEAINTLLDANGSGSFAEVNALQRIWRNSNVAARHAVILPQVSLETYGKALLGVQEHITPII
jgi:alkylation response protein AidB-like acyl-CoA dehydrogenase